MNRFKVIFLLLLLAGGIAVWLLFDPALLSERAPDVSSVRYDVDADGNVDLVRWQVEEAVALWEWDRDADGTPELVAYDTRAGVEDELSITGQITAWDWGADAIIDEGAVPPAAERLLQREEVAAARAGEATGNIALVGTDIRQLVDRIHTGYDDWRLDGLRMPIVGASLPDLDTLLPGAPRAYRNGVHQGFDMNNGHIGVPTGYSGPVVAAKDGTVVRATLNFTEMNAVEYADAIATSQAAGTTPPDILDKLRGRQVWIDHGHGIVTRYVHLSGIAADIVEGSKVRAGDIIGFVGNSGTEASVNGSRAGAHLHFELRIDDRYLGEGLGYRDVRELANRVFKLDPSGD